VSNSDNQLRGHCDGCQQHITGMGDREGVIMDGSLMCDECAVERHEAEMRAGQLDDEIDRRRKDTGRGPDKRKRGKHANRTM
jgi:hypothetical protein